MTNLMPSSKLPSPNSTNPSSRHCRAVAGLLTALGLTLASLALSPVAQAIDPPPDGGYPNQNTAEGEDALFNLTTGFSNTAIGYRALYGNTTGLINTGGGFNALGNTVGEGNTANGFRALVHNTTGKRNIALGNNAGENLTTGNNNIEIGNPGVAGEANAIHIGKEGTQTATFI